MEAESPRWSRRSKVLWIVIGGAGVVLLLLLGGMYGLIMWHYEGLHRAACAFAEDLLAGRFDAAYAKTSREYRAQVELEDFRQNLRRYPSLQRLANPSNFGSSGGGQPGDRRHFITVFDVTAPGTQYIVTAVMIVEDGEWKVLEFGMPAEQGGLENLFQLLLSRTTP